MKNDLGVKLYSIQVFKKEWKYTFKRRIFATYPIYWLCKNSVFSIDLKLTVYIYTDYRYTQKTHQIKRDKLIQWIIPHTHTAQELNPQQKFNAWHACKNIYKLFHHKNINIFSNIILLLYDVLKKKINKILNCVIF